MFSRPLERAVLRLAHPGRYAPDPPPPQGAAALEALHAELARIERRQHWRLLLQTLGRCAAHLVLQGDETKD